MPQHPRPHAFTTFLALTASSKSECLLAGASTDKTNGKERELASDGSPGSGNANKTASPHDHNHTAQPVTQRHPNWLPTRPYSIESMSFSTWGRVTCASPRLTSARGNRQGNGRPSWERGGFSCSEFLMPHGPGAAATGGVRKSSGGRGSGRREEGKGGRGGGRGEERGRENQALDQVW